MMLYKNSLFFFVLLILAAGCSPEESNSREHYFLKGYDHLEFRDPNGNPVPVSEYIYSTRTNGVRDYGIRDTSFMLVHNRSGKPYTGFIRTFHRQEYNLQGEFKDGKIFRLRYWHSNRVLGMDIDFRAKTKSLWDVSGGLVLSQNSEEIYYYYPGTQAIKQVITDTMRSYFNTEGELTRYTIFRDSAVIHHYGNGTPRLKLPFTNQNIMDGEVKRWHPNGQLQAIGQYKNGEQYGTWIEYDSLGNEIGREVYNR